MNAKVWIGVGVAAVVAVGLAVVGMQWTSAPGSQVTRVGPTEPEVAPMIPDVARPDQRPAEPPLASAAPRAVPAVPAGAPELQALASRHDAALAASLVPDDLPDDASRQDVDRAWSEHLRAKVADVEVSVAEHLSFAQRAPRSQADIAVQRAIGLHEDLAASLRASGVPPHLSGTEARVYGDMVDRLATKHERMATVLRAEGAPKEPVVVNDAGNVGPRDGQ